MDDNAMFDPNQPGVLILWDGSRKPDWDTLTENIVSVGGATYHIARFETLPFEDAAEYDLYQKALEDYRRQYHKQPISKEDYLDFKSIVGKAGGLD